MGMHVKSPLRHRWKWFTRNDKSINHCFEIKSESLIWHEGSYQPYTHKQWGVALLLMAATLEIGMLAFNDEV